MMNVYEMIDYLDKSLTESSEEQPIHISTRRGRKKKWDYDSVKAEASKYSTKVEFRKNSPAYQIALKNGWLNDCFENQRKTWDYDSVKAEASKYSTKVEFMRNSPSAYEKARENGLLDDCFQKKNLYKS